MDFSQNEVSPVRRFGGLGVVILVHILVAYALINGLANKIVDVIKQPEKIEILIDKKPPPPEDKPPPPPPPKMVAPPPPYIPPPEVVVQTQTPPPITETTGIAPSKSDFVKTAPTNPGKVQPPIPGFADINSCRPEYPRAALLAEEQGIVRVQFEVGANAQLVGTPVVVKTSGFKDLDRAAVNGLSRCKFRAAFRDGAPVQSTFMFDFVWKMDE